MQASAGCLTASAEAAGRDPAAAISQVTGTVTQHHEAGRLGTLCAVLGRLAQAQRAAGQIDDAQASLQRASAQPGPCRALMIDHLDRRLRDLA